MYKCFNCNKYLPVKIKKLYSFDGYPIPVYDAEYLSAEIPANNIFCPVTIYTKNNSEILKKRIFDELERIIEYLIFVEKLDYFSKDFTNKFNVIVHEVMNYIFRKHNHCCTWDCK